MPTGSGVRWMVAGISAMAAVLCQPARVTGQELAVSFAAGRVTLMAQDVSLGAILDEWAAAGDTEFIDADGLSSRPLHLRLVDTPESEALRIVLREAAGYVAAPRTPPLDGRSAFRRVIVMSTSRGATRAAGSTPRTDRPRPAPSPSGPRVMMPRGTGTEDAMTENDAFESLRQLLPQPGSPIVRGTGNGVPEATTSRPPTAPRPGMPVESTDDAAPVFVRPVRPQPDDR